MTLNEVIKRINAAILDVPQEERIRKLAGKNSFLQGLLRQEMVESDEAKAALAEYHMRAEITWDFGVPVTVTAMVRGSFFRSSGRNAQSMAGQPCRLTSLY